MEQKIKTYRTYTEIEPSGRLLGRIMKAISMEESKFAVRRRVFAIAAFSASFAACIVAGIWLFGDAAQSGFTQTLSLVFSDSSIAMQNWSDFLTSALDTLPYASLVACLASACLVLWSLRFFARSEHYYEEHHVNGYV